MPTTPTDLDLVTHLPEPLSPSAAPQGPFGNICLSNAHQEGICNLFNGYSMQSPVPEGEELIRQISEIHEPESWSIQ